MPSLDKSREVRASGQYTSAATVLVTCRLREAGIGLIQERAMSEALQIALNQAGLLSRA